MNILKSKWFVIILAVISTLLYFAPTFSIGASAYGYSMRMGFSAFTFTAGLNMMGSNVSGMPLFIIFLILPALLIVIWFIKKDTRAAAKIVFILAIVTIAAWIAAVIIANAYIGKYSYGVGGCGITPGFVINIILLALIAFFSRSLYKNGEPVSSSGPAKRTTRNTSAGPVYTGGNTSAPGAGKKTCPVCGAPMKEDDMFCVSCGSKYVAPAPAPAAPEQPSGRICKSCGASLRDADMFCIKCGAKYTEPVKAAAVPETKAPEAKAQSRPLCRKCGAPIVEGSLFCIVCGTRVEAPAEPAVTSAVPVVPDPEPVMPKPEAPAAQPELVIPEPVAEPEPETAVPQPELVIPEPAAEPEAPAAQPELVMPECAAEPEQETAVPQPELVIPEPTAESEPAISESEPETDAAEMMEMPSGQKAEIPAEPEAPAETVSDEAFAGINMQDIGEVPEEAEMMGIPFEPKTVIPAEPEPEIPAAAAVVPAVGPEIPDEPQKTEEVFIAAEKKICPNCGNELKESALFCTNCGTKYEKPAAVTEKICPSCGKKNAPDSRFCEECGTRL